MSHDSTMTMQYLCKYIAISPIYIDIEYFFFHVECYTKVCENKKRVGKEKENKLTIILQSNNINNDNGGNWDDGYSEM